MRDELELAAGGAAGQRDGAAPNVLIADALGEVFDRLRALDAPCVLWRSRDPSRISSDIGFELVVCATYGAPEWETIQALSLKAPTLIVTSAYQRAELREALRRDLIGYLDLAAEPAVFDRAMRGALTRGEVAFPRDAIGEWMRERRLAASEQNGDGASLTRRQHEIVQLIARGATDKEIAASLGIAPTTAQKHVTNILRRLQVPNRAAAVAIAGGFRGAWQPS